MVLILLQSFIGAKSKIKIRTILYFSAAVIALVAGMIIPYILSKNDHDVLSFIIAVLCIVAYFTILAVFDIKNRKRTLELFEDYNQTLDKLKNILEGFKFTSDANKMNWYSKAKIIHLIKMCEAEIEDKKRTNKALEFAKTCILPIISFIAGIAADNIHFTEIISIAVVAIFVMVILYCLNAAVNFIADIILKSTSVYEMKRLSDALKDLLARDFDEIL